MKNNYWIYYSVLLVFALSSCHQKSGKEFESETLSSFENEQQLILIKNTLYDKEIETCLEQINCLSSTHIHKRLVLAKNFNPENDSLILVIPFSYAGNDFNSPGYSNISSRFILIQPSEIKKFATANTFGGTKSFESTVNLVLLHELGHFAIQKSGGFEMNTEKVIKYGQLITEPQYITTMKKIELQVDSLAMRWVSQDGIYNSYSKCSSVCTDIQLLIPTMEFQLSSKRMIDKFGNPNIDFLSDNSFTHPNLELRVTFMDYYLNTTLEKRKRIDNYLYKRTVEPIHNQEFDPRIFQGLEKELK